jgi:hypothetical protein
MEPPFGDTQLVDGLLSGLSNVVPDASAVYQTQSSTLVPHVKLDASCEALSGPTNAAFVDFCSAESKAACAVQSLRSEFFKHLVHIRDTVSVNAFKRARRDYRRSYEVYRAEESKKGRELVPWGAASAKEGIDRQLAIFVYSKSAGSRTSLGMHMMRFPFQRIQALENAALTMCPTLV